MSSLHNAVEKHFFHHPHIMLTSDTSRNHLPFFLLQGKKEIVYYSYLGIENWESLCMIEADTFCLSWDIKLFKIDKLFF